MAAGYVQVPVDSTGKKVDCVSLSSGGNTVMRQVAVIGDPTASAGYASIVGGALKVTGTIDKISATVAVSGQVSLGPGTSNIGTINNISAVVAVSGQVSLGPSTNNIGGVSLVAGTSNIGFIDKISAAVALAAGTQHIGEVNISTMPAVNISAMPNVTLAAGTNNIGFINGISQTVNVAGTFTIGTIDKISATVTSAISGFFDSSAGSSTIVKVGDSANSAIRCSIVAGISTTAVCVGSGFYDSSAGSNTTVRVGDSANSAMRVNVVAGTLAMSGLLDGISATVNVTGSVYCTGDVKMSASNTAAVGTSLPIWLDKNGRQVIVHNNPSLPPSATHGPKYCGAISASGGATLIASPGAGKSLFITGIEYSNLNATTGTILFVYEGSATATPLLVAWVPGNNAGKAIQYNPPARISSGTALSAKVKPNVDGIPINVHFFTGID